VWQAVVHGQPDPLPSSVSQEVKKLVSLLLTKAPDRRPTIDWILKTNLVSRYVNALIGYGREIKRQIDLLKDEGGPDQGDRK